MKNFKLILSLIFLSATAFAEDLRNLAISVEQDRNGKVESVGLLWSKKQLEMTISSNFLFPNQKPIKLGYFKTTLTDSLQLERQEIELLVESTHGFQSPKSPHEVRIFINGKKYSIRSDLGKRVKNFLENISKRATFKMVDGIEIQTRPKEGCEQINVEYFRCEIPKYGTVYWLKK